MGFEWLPTKNYKRHYICLKCQKGFKRASKEDMKNPVNDDFSNLINEYYETASKTDIVKYINARHQKIKVSCPQCKNAMLQVHYDFEVPSQRDTKSWKHLRETLQTTIDYETYMQWHRIKLQETPPNTPEYKLLKLNLEKLINHVTSKKNS
ncbi:hypothetical protein IMCC3317_39710 [Kordia antarctica]|uniref:Uncharacterized protein n=1 Tax=Kordia antarctica TaxID=1218801 RepID=A0A7L4ZQ29_9FLAO|nr:hypothetical protein [Kordia antarctica]QHI38577.1 hypothetical protein IMCC3317_39710 [Kordia antarctica]